MLDPFATGVLRGAFGAAFRARRQARSGAVPGWREVLTLAAVSMAAATCITGGERISGGFPADVVRRQLFEASSDSPAASVKPATEPTSLFRDRTGLTTGQPRRYWIRNVLAGGNVSDFVAPVMRGVIHLSVQPQSMADPR